MAQQARQSRRVEGAQAPEAPKQTKNKKMGRFSELAIEVEDLRREMAETAQAIKELHEAVQLWITRR